MDKKNLITVQFSVLIKLYSESTEGLILKLGAQSEFLGLSFLESSNGASLSHRQAVTFGESI